jgi:hypothetical protein
MVIFIIFTIVNSQVNLCCSSADSTGPLQIVNGVCLEANPYNCDLI